MRRLFFSSAAAVAVFAFPARAHAKGGVDVEAAVRVGYGTDPGMGGTEDPNPLGLGIGARAGITRHGIYAGLGFDYYFGGNGPSEPTALGAFSVSEHALKYGGEVGYDFKLLDVITFRPQIGLGVFTLYDELGTSGLGSSTEKESNLYLEPGLVGLVSLGTVFVGADANALIVPWFTWDGQSSTYVAFTAHGQIGVKF